MLNAAISHIEVPSRMARRPVDRRGFPVPWFVAKIDGEWDFRAIEAGKITLAVGKRLCWLCGEPLGKYLAFVIGPMCAINRVTSEPPSHLDCAVFAAQACPFLAHPNMRRNEKHVPDHKPMPGHPLEHNPGATLIWIAKTYSEIRDHIGGRLFEIGPPIETRWFKEGRAATRAEARAAIDKGLPYLRELASIEDAEAERDLETMITTALKLLPP